MTACSCVYVYWKYCKKDRAEEVGVDVNNLIMDVLQAAQGLLEGTRCRPISLHDANEDPM